MKKGNIHKKQKFFILSACCLIFILAVVGVFAIYQHSLKDSYHFILTSGLEKSTNEQKEHVESIVSDIQKLLSMLGTAELAASVDECELVIQDECIYVDYLDAQEVLNMSSSSNFSDSGKALLEQLAAGDEVITALGEPYFTESDSLFALLYPVFLDDNLVGILRAQIDAALLTDGNVDSVSFFQKVYTILTSADGNIIYANTPYPDGHNLFSSALQGGIGSDEMQSVCRSFEENEGKTISFQGKGNKYYMSWEALDFNDWRIVRFARSPDIVLQTTTIMRGMISFGICLIALTAIFCVVMLRLILRQKRELDTRQRRYDALDQFNDTLLFEYDIAANCIVFTPNALECLDIDAQFMEGLSVEYYMSHLLHPDDRDGFKQAFHSFNIALGETHYLEARLRCLGGKYNWFGCQFKSIENEGECTTRLIGKLVDINEQHEREQLLRQATLEDALTGVYNRAAETVINKQLEKNTQGLFLMIDLDNFKRINDTSGHDTGDALLISVAQILREVFGPTEIVARIGGDEFVVFISGTNDLEVAENGAAEVQSRMEQLNISGNTQLVSASIGIAIAPQDGSTYGMLAHAADQAMYGIKRKGKKGFAFS